MYRLPIQLLNTPINLLIITIIIILTIIIWNFLHFLYTHLKTFQFNQQFPLIRTLYKLLQHQLFQLIIRIFLKIKHLQYLNLYRIHRYIVCIIIVIVILSPTHVRTLAGIQQISGTIALLNNFIRILIVTTTTTIILLLLVHRYIPHKPILLVQGHIDKRNRLNHLWFLGTRTHNIRHKRIYIVIHIIYIIISCIMVWTALKYIIILVAIL